MGLEESPHCPVDVMEACRTGVRRDYHQPEEKLEARPIASKITYRGRQQRVKGGSEALPAVGRGGGEGPVAAALGRPS